MQQLPPPKKNRSWLLTTIPSLSILLHAQIRLTLQSDFGHPNLFCSPCHVDAGYPGSGNMAFSSWIIFNTLDKISCITSGVLVVFYPRGLLMNVSSPPTPSTGFLPSTSTPFQLHVGTKKSTLAVSSPNISPNINHKKMGNLEFCGTTLGCSPKVNSHGNGKSPCLNCKIHLPNSWMSKNHCHVRKSRGDFLNLPRFSSFQRFPNLIVVKDVVLFLHRSGSCLGLGGSSWKDGGSEWNSGGKVVLPGCGPRVFPFWSKACFLNKD